MKHHEGYAHSNIRTPITIMKPHDSNHVSNAIFSGMAKAEKSLRQQLLDARAEIERQIEILRSGPLMNSRTGGGPDFASPIAALTATLHEIEKRLADLGKDDA